MLWIALALARPPTGERQVIVVLKDAACAVCTAQLTRLGQAELGANVMGLTHGSAAEAAKVTRSTGVSTWSHLPGIKAMGLWMGTMARPAVVVYDKCGKEVGRLVGRAPKTDATPEVRSLLRQADDASCDRPQS